MKISDTHHFQADEVVRLLETDLKDGLTESEVVKRQDKYGPNRLTPRQRMSSLKRFALQFHQPLIYILLLASGVTFFLREWVDSGVIFAVVFINAIIGYFQESKAEKAIDALTRMVVTEATVRRDGRSRRVPSDTLVPGDVVLLASGDKVPADIRFSFVRNLQVDESALTGESVPVEKHSDPLGLDTILAERRNQAFAGTLVTYGQAEGVVWRIGDQTEMGHIGSLISEAADLSTPLTRTIQHFSQLLLYAILALSAVTFAAGIFRGGAIVEMFMASVALAVGAIPEGLPAAVTVTLGVGVSRMAKRGAIIRKLPAVETLGSTTVICSDKTGTLTQNQMTVQDIWAGGQRYDVTGSGYRTEGQIRGPNGAPQMNKALWECLRSGFLCNDSRLVEDTGSLKIEGDPTEAALLVAARKAGFSKDETATFPRIDVIPFESQHQYMATLHRSNDMTTSVVYVKGSVEQLLSRCGDMLQEDGTVAPLNREAISGIVENMASKGLRVLAFAKKNVAANHEKLTPDNVAQNLTFLGLQGMVDPPRPEAIEAVRKCQTAGIHLKMITGDHIETATAIARQIGLIGEGSHPSRIAMTGQELERLSEEELNNIIQQTVVFARVAPEQKLRLVRALQANGQVTAMTGDGVNDAPALKQANIGIAMGIMGTDVAKGAADMILTDDNFATIEKAVEEGRQVFDNLTKFIVWTLPTNAGEAGILLTAIFAGISLPIVPVQLLWINMTTAVILGVMLIFEPKEKDLMMRPPRDSKVPLLTPLLFGRIGLVTAVMMAGAFGLFYWEQSAFGISLAEARTIVVNVIVTVEAFYLLNCRSLKRSMFSLGLFTNPWVIVGIFLTVFAQMAFTYVPTMNRLFHSAPIGAETWVHILGVGALAYLAVETEKWVRLRLEKQSPSSRVK